MYVQKQCAKFTVVSLKAGSVYLVCSDTRKDHHRKSSTENQPLITNEVDNANPGGIPLKLCVWFKLLPVYIQVYLTVGESHDYLYLAGNSIRRPKIFIFCTF